MEAPSGRELAFAAAGALMAGTCLALSSGSAVSTTAPAEPITDSGANHSAVETTKPVQSRSRESETILVPVERLKKFTRDVFVHCGCLQEEATLAAEVLILADHRGIDSHGVARLHAYFTLLEAGEINPRPNVRKVTSTSTTATVDGDNGLGLIVGPKANAIAMEMAEQHGSGWVSVKNTNHYGIAGFYSLQAVERDMIGFSMTTSSAVVAPLWGKQRMLGTNPIAVAFPGTEGVNRPIVIDFATSVVPWGKIEEHARMGKALLDGWAIDPKGSSATVPEDVLGSGALMNLGGDRDHSGHKGYCLSAMVDILCAVLSGGNWGPTVDGFTTNKLQAAFTGDAGETGTTAADSNSSKNIGECDNEDEKTTGIGHFFGAMRIDGFRPPRHFKSTIDTWITAFRNVPPVESARPVLIPGDPEWEAMDKRGVEGVPVKMAVVADLVDIATRTGVALPFDDEIDVSGIKRVKATTNLSAKEQEANSKQ